MKRTKDDEAIEQLAADVKTSLKSRNLPNVQHLLSEISRINAYRTEQGRRQVASAQPAAVAQLVSMGSGVPARAPPPPLSTPPGLTRMSATPIRCDTDGVFEGVWGDSEMHPTSGSLTALVCWIDPKRKRPVELKRRTLLAGSIDTVRFGKLPIRISQRDSLEIFFAAWQLKAVTAWLKQ